MVPGGGSTTSTKKLTPIKSPSSSWSSLPATAFCPIGGKRRPSAMARRQALVIIAQQGYQDAELAGTLEGLKASGYDYSIVSKRAGPCKGKLGGEVEAKHSLSEALQVWPGFDRVAFIGGPGAHGYAKDPEALQLAKVFTQANKVVGAICVAPTILAAAGVLHGKKATVFTSDSNKEDAVFLRNHGVNYMDNRDVVVDGKFITAVGPSAAKEFGAAFANAS